MIAVNELHELKCHKKEILEPLLILLTPYAPHIAEELTPFFFALGSTMVYFLVMPLLVRFSIGMPQAPGGGMGPDPPGVESQPLLPS